MGQYYKAIILNEDKKTIKAHATSWDYQSGSKLMEHSWMLNDFVARVEIELLNNPQILVWAGDYADPEVDDKGNIITLARYVRFRAVSPGKLPAWHPAAGNPTWLFVDEIVVR